MENLYCIFENLALKMSVTLILVIMIKLIFKNKLNARTHCMMWLLSLVQLIFCIGDVQIQTDTSIYTAIDTAVVTGTSFNYKPLVSAVWIIGMAVFALWHIISYATYMHRIRSLPTAEETPTIIELRSLLGIPESRRLTLRIGKSAQTVSDTIIIPESFGEDEKYHILLHELCHFAHRDNLKQWTALVILCINWFNPIVWAAFGMFRTDIEMLCDERVLKITDKKREYAQVLVKSSAMRSGFIPGAVSATRGKREVFSRIKRIVNFKRMNPVWLIAAALGCAAVAVVCLTVPKEIEPVIIYREVPTPQPASPTAEPVVVVHEPTAPEAIETPTAAPQQHNEYIDVGKVSPRNEPVRKQENAPVRQSGNEYVDIEPQENIVAWETPSDGTRESVSGNGTKETYRLDDGTQAVVQYDDGEVKNRYIIVE